jgi:hypothetical protein
MNDNPRGKHQSLAPSSSLAMRPQAYPSSSTTSLLPKPHPRDYSTAFAELSSLHGPTGGAPCLPHSQPVLLHPKSSSGGWRSLFSRPRRATVQPTPQEALVDKCGIGMGSGMGAGWNVLEVCAMF